MRLSYPRSASRPCQARAATGVFPLWPAGRSRNRLAPSLFPAARALFQSCEKEDLGCK